MEIASLYTCAVRPKYTCQSKIGNSVVVTQKNFVKVSDEMESVTWRLNDEIKQLKSEIRGMVKWILFFVLILKVGIFLTLFSKMFLKYSMSQMLLRFLPGHITPDTEL